jgi:hypothetical protein
LSYNVKAPSRGFVVFTKRILFLLYAIAGRRPIKQRHELYLLFPAFEYPRLSSGKGFLGTILNWLNGGSKLEQIEGTSDYTVRDHHTGGMGGHMVGTWLNDLIDYWRSLGIKVTVVGN